jgi:prevent-host-death family protein
MVRFYKSVSLVLDWSIQFSVMKTVGSYEAKTHLPRLLDDVAAGETVLITKHGLPVAKLVPVGNSRPMEVTAAIQALRQLRREVALERNTLQEYREEGRRF